MLRKKRKRVVFLKHGVVYRVPKTVSCLMFDNNVGKCGPIFKILSPGDLWENSLCTCHNDFHLTCGALLHYLVKIENPKMLLTLTAPQQTIDMFLMTLWGLDLSFNRQTVSRLLMLTDCLTFWSLSDDVSNQQLNLIPLNIVASWRFYNHDYLRTFFVVSRLCFVCCTHI